MATKTIRKYKLLPGVGPHYEPNPEFDPTIPEDEENFRDQEYSAGDVVKTTRPLDRIFVNKFKPLAGATPGQTSGGDSHDPEDDPNADRPVRSTEDANVRRGDRFQEEDELEGKPDLKKLAKGKKVKNAEDEEEEDNEESSEEPEDVTDEFEGAKEGGLEVKKDEEGKYHVYEEGEDEPMEGSKKGFSTKKKTLMFVKKNVKDSEDDEE